MSGFPFVMKRLLLGYTQCVPCINHPKLWVCIVYVVFFSIFYTHFSFIIDYTFWFVSFSPAFSVYQKSQHLTMCERIFWTRLYIYCAALELIRCACIVCQLFKRTASFATIYHHYYSRYFISFWTFFSPFYSLPLLNSSIRYTLNNTHWHLNPTKRANESTNWTGVNSVVVFFFSSSVVALHSFNLFGRHFNNGWVQNHILIPLLCTTNT